MKIICGLGNPGIQYENTRHNVGFLCLDHIAHHFNFPLFAPEKTLHAQVSIGMIPQCTEKIILVKPDTYMNRSGAAVQAVMHYYKSPISDLIVIHDDLDIAIGKFKISHNTRAAGHNGIQNIIDMLGTQDFMRVRIGIESEGGKKTREHLSGEAYVLQNFSPTEKSEYVHVYNTIITQIFDTK